MTKSGIWNDVFIIGKCFPHFVIDENKTGYIRKAYISNHTKMLGVSSR